MKKPQNYYGYAWDNPTEHYNIDYINTVEGQIEIRKETLKNKKHQEFNKQNGFDATETWNLDNTISQFVLPRLKYFRNNLISYPGDITEKEWEKILDKMIFAFEYNVSEMSFEESQKHYKKYQKGMRLFAKYFQHLWS